MSFLSQPIVKAVSEDWSGPGVSYGASAVQGWRRYQEDSHICLPEFEDNASLWAVFDGHNGAEVAIFASKRFPKILKENKNYKTRNYETALKESFMALDDLLMNPQSIRELVAIRQSYSKVPITKSTAPGIASGCTATVVLIKDKVLYCANCGDSRSILSRNGKAFALSADHKPDDDNEKRRIETAGGEVTSGRINYGINVSRAFGDHLYKRNTTLAKDQQMVIAVPDVRKEKLRPVDNLLVLICDGVWNSVPNEDLIAYVNKRVAKNVKPLSKICEEIFKQIIPTVMPIKGIVGKDNMTFLIVKFESNDPSIRTNSSRQSTAPKKFGLFF